MRDPKTWMWVQALDFLERAQRSHRQFFQVSGYENQPIWEPPIDMFETEDELWLLAALPDVRADKIRVVIDGNALIVEGERCVAAYLSGAVIHRLEIPYGKISRRVPLPAGRYELGRHELKDGCLVLSLRKLSIST